MVTETVYIVQSFQPGRGARLKADPPSAHKTERAAQRVAERLAQSRTGVVVLANTGDPDTGDYDEEPKVLFRAGRIPPELDV